MDSHTLKVLEFDKILGFLKNYASSPGGRKRCQCLQPLPELDRVQRLLREVANARGAGSARVYPHQRGAGH